MYVQCPMNQIICADSLYISLCCSKLPFCAFCLVGFGREMVQIYKNFESRGWLGRICKSNGTPGNQPEVVLCVDSSDLRQISHTHSLSMYLQTILIYSCVIPYGSCVASTFSKGGHVSHFICDTLYNCPALRACFSGWQSYTLSCHRKLWLNKINLIAGSS